MARPRITTSTHAIVMVLLVGLGIVTTAFAQSDPYAGEPINYMTTEVNDPVAKLARAIEAGEKTLDYDDESGQGYLKALLAELEVPESSQTLVFSKTSLQLNRISPRRPRAVYFNDNVYVGYCQNGEVLELAATDGNQGATFYTLAQDKDSKPEFVRDQGLCLSCHSTHRTQDVPGYLVRSVFSDPTGRPILGSGTFVTDLSSPFEQRWGGWYVTGTHGSMKHMGNALYGRDREPISDAPNGNRENLADIVDIEPYLTPHSDVVALMVMEHQSQMHNALAAANYEARRAVYQSYQMNDMLDRPEGFLSESAERRLDKSAERVVKYLFMTDEFELTDRVAGTSDFAKEFAAQGPFDSKHRSLRQFDLTKRVFKFPCSYLIYSEAFDALPEQLRQRVDRRIAEILEGTDDSGEFDHLTDADRNNIIAILRDTKPDVLTELSAAALAQAK